MNEVDKLKADAQELVVINKALDLSVGPVLAMFAHIEKQRNSKTARRFLGSICATVVGSCIEASNRGKSKAVINKLIQIELTALGNYLASQNDELLEVDADRL
jgi:hypothetical protein